MPHRVLESSTVFSLLITTVAVVRRSLWGSIFVSSLRGAPRAISTAAQRSHVVTGRRPFHNALDNARLTSLFAGVIITVTHSRTKSVITRFTRCLRDILFGSSLTRPATGVIVLGITLRLLVVPLSILQINPYSQDDAVKFTQFATRIGHGLAAGHIVVGSLSPGRFGVAIYRVWGLVLSPFWILVGPSELYAHLALIGLSAFAIYNVYAIARWFYSARAGWLAAFPVAVYPSFVFIHASLLREAAVLAGITTAARVLVVGAPSKPFPLSMHFRQWTYTVLRAMLALGALAFAGVLRLNNIPIYLLALGVGAALYWIESSRFLAAKKLTAGVMTGAVASLALLVSGRVLQTFQRLRELRDRGRTAYLGRVAIETVPEMVLFAPLGALYFLFTPLPWMISTVMDLVIAAEVLISVVFAVASVAGARYTLQRAPTKTLALVTGFLAAILVYGVGTVNVGTAVRHRQMFLWVLFVFGAVGLVRWLDR